MCVLQLHLQVEGRSRCKLHLQGSSKELQSGGWAWGSGKRVLPALTSLWPLKKTEGFKFLWVSCQSYYNSYPHPQGRDGRGYFSLTFKRGKKTCGDARKLRSTKKKSYTEWCCIRKVDSFWINSLTPSDFQSESKAPPRSCLVLTYLSIPCRKIEPLAMASDPPESCVKTSVPLRSSRRLGDKTRPRESREFSGRKSDTMNDITWPK